MAQEQQREIINGLWADYRKAVDPALSSEQFNFYVGAFTALGFARQQFRELMDEWYGSEDFQDEKLEMTRLFDERLGF